MTNNQMKAETLTQMATQLAGLKSKFGVLVSLDNDVTTSGWGDLQDQLVTMANTLKAFEDVLERAKSVVPAE